MLPLVYPRRWSIAGGLLLLAVLGFSLAPAIFPWRDTGGISWFAISDKWLHAMTFAFLALWYSGQFSRSTYGLIAMGLAAFGGIIEVLQSMLAYRTAELGDFYADLLGIGVGLAVAITGIGGWSLRAEVWLQRNFG